MQMTGTREEASPPERSALTAFIALNEANRERDRPRSDALLDELRGLREAHLDESSIRELLAQSLFNTLSEAEEGGDLRRRDGLLDELRALRRAYPEDEGVGKPLAKVLFGSLLSAEREGDLEGLEALTEEMRTLLAGLPDDAPKEPMSLDLLHWLTEGEEPPEEMPFEERVWPVETLREVLETHAKAPPLVRRTLAKVLISTLDEAIADGDHEGRDELLDEIRALQRAYTDDDDLRDNLVSALTRTRDHPRDGDDPVRADTLLDEIQALRQGR